MADTIYYNANGEVLPYDSIPDDLKKYIDQARQSTETNYPVLQKEDEGDYTAFVVVMTFFILLGFFAVKSAWRAKGTEILGSWKGLREKTGYGLFAVEKYHDADERFRDLTKDYFVYHGRDIIIAEEQYEKILGKRSAYYRQLTPELKETFVARLKDFMGSKIFLIKSEEPFVDMPLLISATAVQLTFGLDKYKLPHYEYIRVFKEEYFAADKSLRVLAGHVFGNTITLAWNHFLRGHEESSDGVNLGLHEMAHALYFQLVEAQTGKCNDFRANFELILKEGNELYQLKDVRPSSLFTKNAYRNLQEFWAETVELFFERPVEFRREHPDLYRITQDILKQDPVNTPHPLNVST